MKRLMAAVAVLVVLVVLAVAVSRLRTSSPTIAERDPGLAAPNSTSSDVQQLAARQGNREAIALVDAATERAVRTDAGTRATLVVQTNDDHGEPLPGTRVHVLAGPALDAVEPPNDASATGDDGAVSIAVPSGQRLVVQVESRDDIGRLRAFTFARVAVEPLTVGQARRVVCTALVDCSQRFRARFVAAESGVPLSSGAIRPLRDRSVRGGRVGDFGAGAPIAELDALGRLELCHTVLPDWSLFTSAGRSPQMLRPFDTSGDAGPDRDIAVERSAGLSVAIVDRSRRAGGDVVVEVRTDTRWILSPVNRGAVAGGSYVRTERLDPSGVARFVDLPANAPLDVRVQRGSTPICIHPSTVVIGAGEERSLELEIGAGAQLIVDVFDQTWSSGGSGMPVKGYEIGLARDGISAADGQTSALVASNDPPKFQRREKTGDRGRVLFEGVEPGTWWVALVPVRKPWDKEIEYALAPVAQRVDIAATDTCREVTLRTWRGLYIRGRIEVPDGRLFPPNAKPDTSPNVILIVHAADGGGGLTGQPELDGSFAIGPVTDGEYVIETFARHYAPIDPIHAHASDGPLVIRMQLGADINGRVIDPGTSQGVVSDFVLSRLDAAMTESSGSTDDAGSCGFSGIAPGDYVISAVARDGRTGVSERVHVEAGQKINDLRVRLQPLESTGRVRIVLEGAVAPGRVTLWKDGVCRAFAFVDKGAVIELPMPEGACELRLYAGETQIERRDVDVTRGTVSNVRIQR